MGGLSVRGTQVRIARELGVSAATICRDLESLRHAAAENNGVLAEPQGAHLAVV
jgi:hypothetical protein